MAGTVQIPLTALPVGQRTFGPVTVADADSAVTMTIDRTVTGGLNSLTAASALSVLAEMSTDGGATWHAVDAGQPGTVTAWSTIGGALTFTDKVGGVHTYTESSARWSLFAGADRQVRATVTAAGTPIAVAGSIATQ